MKEFLCQDIAFDHHREAQPLHACPCLLPKEQQRDQQYLDLLLHRLQLLDCLSNREFVLHECEQCLPWGIVFPTKINKTNELLSVIFTLSSICLFFSLPLYYSSPNFRDYYYPCSVRFETCVHQVWRAIYFLL